MVLSVSSKREYVPKFNDNGKAPVADQIKILHKAPTIAIKERLFPKRFEFDKDGDVTGSFEIDRYRILKEFIVEIINCSYKITDEMDVVVKIRDAKSLFDAPPEFDSLIDELYNYFQELLNRKAEEKN
jgi:hypothetical protein